MQFFNTLLSVLAIDSDSNSDWQSDWDSSDDLEGDAAVASPSKSQSGEKSKKVSENEPSSALTSAAGFESDNSDGQSEKCPICLLPFRKQEIANPASCEHCFCLECIVEWSKNINTCPVDRQKFTVINVREKLGGKVWGKVFYFQTKSICSYIFSMLKMDIKAF